MAKPIIITGFSTEPFADGSRAGMRSKGWFGWNKVLIERTKSEEDLTPRFKIWLLIGIFVAAVFAASTMIRDATPAEIIQADQLSFAQQTKLNIATCKMTTHLYNGCENDWLVAEKWFNCVQATGDRQSCDVAKAQEYFK